MFAPQSLLEVCKIINFNYRGKIPYKNQAKIPHISETTASTMITFQQMYGLYLIITLL